MPVVRLLRFASYFSTDGYYIGGSHQSLCSSDIPFMRGDSKATERMEDLAKVDFGPDTAVTVLLKSGTKGSGKLSSESEGIDGFCNNRLGHQRLDVAETGGDFFPERGGRARDKASVRPSASYTCRGRSSLYRGYPRPLSWPHSPPGTWPSRRPESSSWRLEPYRRLMILFAAYRIWP